MIADNYLSNARNVHVGEQSTWFSWTDGPRPGPSIAGGPLVSGNYWGRPTGTGFSETSVDRDGDGISDRSCRVAGYMVDTSPLCEGTDRTDLRAGFSFRSASVLDPGTVRFGDRSSGPAGVWDWSFGDGAVGVTRDPVHAYAAPGVYTATLRVRDAAGRQVSERSARVTVPEPVPPPGASFTAAPVVGGEPFEVGFTDASSGSPDEWLWSFGDGTTSNERDPCHVYPGVGDYAVRLRVANAAGSSTLDARLSIRVCTVLDLQDAAGS
ncbi:MAG: PKD domain-containing protein [Methanospirillum sp.]|nr:PKD domain-containing protein [Methanospirillum sp.]